MKPTDKQTLGEEIANAVSHGVMGIFGIVSLILLLVKSHDWKHTVAGLIFGGGIIMLYLMSTLYHAFSHKKTKYVFRKFDHLSIYLLIGSTFAPFLLLTVHTPVFGGIMTKGTLIFIIQWALITLGIVMKAIWINRFEMIHVVLFLLMGWSALFFIQDVKALGDAPFLLVLFGGISYTIGIGFFVLGRIKYFHFIWHLFVGMGTILHFIAVYQYLY